MTNIALNRRAKFEYHFLDILEAGIVLMGSELKSIRLGKCSIAEAFAGEITENGKRELYLLNANISVYESAKLFGHEPKRPRKLLLHKKQINKLLGSIKRKGLTLVPLRLYFNKKGKVKVEIALAQGKKIHDKREAIKDRDWKRDKARILKATQ